MVKIEVKTYSLMLTWEEDACSLEQNPLEQVSHGHKSKMKEDERPRVTWI